MPYGIPHETPATTKKMERCVAGISGTNPRTGKPYTKSEKIAICKSQIMKGMKGSKEEGFTEQQQKIWFGEKK